MRTTETAEDQNIKGDWTIIKPLNRFKKKVTYAIVAKIRCIAI